MVWFFLLILCLLALVNLLRFVKKRRKKKNFIAIQHFKDKTPSESKATQETTKVHLLLPNGTIVSFESAHAIYRDFFEKLLSNHIFNYHHSRSSEWPS